MPPPFGAAILTLGADEKVIKFGQAGRATPFQTHGMRTQPVTIELGPWRFPQRPRVLIEHPDLDAGLRLATALREAGCNVAVCRGPDAAGYPATRCPLHQLEPCAAVEGADVVVTALGFEREEARDVVAGLRARYPSVPVVVAATVGEAIDLGETLDGCRVVPVDSGPSRVVDAVLASLES
jgi:hypothetical protein